MNNHDEDKLWKQGVPFLGILCLVFSLMILVDKICKGLRDRNRVKG